LEVKIEDVPRRMDSKMRAVEIDDLASKSVNGLMVPNSLEISVLGIKQLHKMTIETVVVDPNVADSLFAKPKSTK